MLTNTQRANRSCRDSGAFNRIPPIVKIIENISYGKKYYILDFGAGKRSKHAIYLRKNGCIVHSHEFGENFGPSIHDDVSNNRYHIIYASNVLNVQSSIIMLQRTIEKVISHMFGAGAFYCNYPAQPRFLKEFTNADMISLLKKYFQFVVREPF